MGRDKILPSWPFNWTDFITDHAVEMMTLEERGAYITLLCILWFSDEPGVVDNDDTILARLSDANERWTVIKTGVLRAFKVRADGKLFQSRMVREARAAQATSAAGRRAANARWMRSQCDRNASASKYNARNTLQPSSERLLTTTTRKSQNTRKNQIQRQSQNQPPHPSLPIPELTEKTWDVALTTNFRLGLLIALERRYPNCDVELVAHKLLEYQHEALERGEHAYKSLNRALMNWVVQAEERGTERRPPKPFDLDAWAREGDDGSG